MKELIRFTITQKSVDIKRCSKYLSENLNIIPSLNKVVNIMRNELILTNKNCLYRLNSIGFDKTKLLCFLFSIIFYILFK